MTSTRNLDLVRSLGADHAVDYTTTDFVRDGRRRPDPGHGREPVGARSQAGAGRGGKAAVTGFTSVPRLLGVSLRGGKDVAQVQASM